MRPSPTVAYVGTADCAAHAVICATCYAAIGTPCIPNRHTGPVPHRCRVDLAAAIGLVDVADAPLLEEV